MNIVIAGGAGFLGSHLVDAHVRRGDRVVVLDNFSTGKLPNLNDSLASGSVDVIDIDVADGVPTFSDVQIVYNLASPASPPAYLQMPFETLAVGSNGTKHLLEMATDCRARFVMASTSEVYGDPTVHPQVEEYRGNVETTGPRSVYDEAKRFSESMTAAFRRYRRTNTGIVRIFNTYGPRLDPLDGRVVSNFIVQALNNEPLTVYGDGSQTRSLCFVSDLIEGIMKFGESNDPGPINLGNPDERTILEIAHGIKEACGASSSIKFLPLPQDDPTQRCPDISRAIELLNWSPTIDFDTGIGATIEFFRATSGQ
jgi:dTDP-glucose 4,6-dehydratase